MGSGLDFLLYSRERRPSAAEGGSPRIAEARRPRVGRCVSRADLEHARGPARVREDRAGIRPARVFDERSEEFARAPRPAAANSEAGRARAAGGRGRTAPPAAPCRSDVTVKLVLLPSPSGLSPVSTPGLDPVPVPRSAPGAPVAALRRGDSRRLDPGERPSSPRASDCMASRARALDPGRHPPPRGSAGSPPRPLRARSSPRRASRRRSCRTSGRAAARHGRREEASGRRGAPPRRAVRDERRTAPRAERLEDEGGQERRSERERRRGSAAVARRRGDEDARPERDEARSGDEEPLAPPEEAAPRREDEPGDSRSEEDRRRAGAARATGAGRGRSRSSRCRGSPRR